VPPYRAEQFGADSNDVVMGIAVTSPGNWNDVAKWYDGLARDRYALTPAVAQRVDSIVKASAARTRLDTIRAVHRWVAQDLRYVSVSLGIGGYQPRPPADVLSTGFGDCKDKTTLFVAALRRYRISANPVLLTLNGKPEPSLPSIYQFNHAIAAVQEGNGWTFTDLTAEYVPYGAIPENYQGQFGIVVLPDGRAQDVRFPVLPVDSSAAIIRVALSLDTSGHAEGRVTEEVRGNSSMTARVSFAVPLDSARRAAIANTLAQRLFSSDARVDSLVAFNGRDLNATTTISYRVKADRVFKQVGEARLFTMNVALKSPALSYKNLARELESKQPRLFPIDASKVLGAFEQVIELRLTLPVGWTAELPKNVLAASFFGRYESTWTQEGREVRLVRRIQGRRGVFPPQRISEMIVWLKTVGADDYEFLSLKPSSVH